MKKNLLIFFLLQTFFSSNVFSKTITAKDIVSQLKLPKGFSISIYCYGLKTPWMMAFDRNDNLFVTIPDVGAVVAIPDNNKDGVGDQVINYFLDLDYPSGICFYNNYIYFATAKTIIKSLYNPGNFNLVKATIIYNDFPNDQDSPLFRTIKFGSSNNLYVSIGFPVNACNSSNEFAGTILRISENSNNANIHAYGFSSPIGFDFNPKNEDLWASDFSKEEIKKSSASDELNYILPNKFYGWPNYYNENIANKSCNKPDINNYSTKPTIKFPPYSSPYSVAFYKGGIFPKNYEGDLFVALHGSNSKSDGYKIVRLIFEKNKPVKVVDFITGWLTPNGEILGQPVDIAFNSAGEMFITDNYYGVIYKVTYKK